MIARFRSRCTAKSAASALVAVVALCVLTACSSTTPKAAPYTYDPGKAAVNVDTAALRAQKAQAGIEDCPRTANAITPGPDALPPLTLPCLGGGRALDLADLTGTPTVVNFWAQTCGPCRQESPLFQRLHETGDVRVIGVDFYDPLPGRAIAFAQELGLTYPQVADPEAATRAPLRIQGLPMTVFVDSHGTIRHVEYGAVQSAGDLATLVSTYLDVDVDLE